MVFGQNHLRGMLRGLDSKPLTFAGTTYPCLMNHEQPVVFDPSGDEIQTTRITVLIETGRPALTEGNDVTVDGVAYRVRDTAVTDNGDLTNVVLAAT